MNRKIIIPLIIILAIAITLIVFVINTNNKNYISEEKDENLIDNIKFNASDRNNISEENNNIVNYNTNIDEKSDKMTKTTNIKVIINNSEYNAKLEDNETVSKFLELLPTEFDMNELNGNEKYIYLNNTLPTNSYTPKYINAGDIMLFGSNCLVVFYKSFDTSYSYTKIGHIDNLPNLGSENVIVKFQK